jgi:hypothetical protein
MIAFLANRERSRQMSKSYILFITAIAPLIAGVCIATGSNAQSTTSDSDYCHSLVKALSMGGDARGSLMVDTDAAVAIAQCQEGNPAPAIPVLQKKLRDNRIPVPPRA